MTAASTPVQRHLTHAESETAAVAETLTRGVGGGTVLLLHGELGAGKTAFVRGVVAAAGGQPDDVSSPTFTLLQPYPGPVTVYHADLYRLEPVDVPDLGLDELVAADTLLVVEWAERWADPPPDAIHIHIEDRGGDEREIVVTHSDSSAPPW